MPKYNLFRINKSSVGLLKSKLSEVGLKRTGGKSIGSFNLDFYLSTEPHASKPDWADLLQQILSLIMIVENQYSLLNVRHAAGFMIEGNMIQPKTMCIWIILDRKNKIQKLSEIDSLIFLIKLDE